MAKGFKNPFKANHDNSYDTLKRLPSDQYGRSRDRIGNQQLERKVRQSSKWNTSLIWGVSIGIVAWLFLMITAVFVESAWNSFVTASAFSQMLSKYQFHLGWFSYIVIALIAILIGAIVYDTMRRRKDSDSLLERDGVINDHDDDARIQTHEEIYETFPVFPNAGAHSSVSPSTLISAAQLDNKHVPKVRVPKRYLEDTEIDGEMFYRGEEMLDNDGNVIYEEKPIIDKKFGEFIYDKSGIDKKNPERVFVDPCQIVLDKNIAIADDQKQELNGKFEPRAIEMIRNDWEVPDYETTLPSGVNFVDTAPVNTMLIAITRAGKGQTVINPTLDMWTREKRQWNIICNDPKGELLREFYVPATKRGYDIVQFNLINSMKTDIFNPLGYAVEAAREGKIDKVSEYLTNLSDIFFPKDGGEDKVWPESAAAAFERSCLGLIDYYLEEEYEIRRRAELDGKNPQLLDAEINNMWGKVSLFNAFQFFLALVSKKETDPMKTWVNPKDKPEMVWDEENGVEVPDPSTPAVEKALLDLFFDATAELPVNDVRRQIESSNNTLKTMAQSEKMLSSIYGIATSGMRFFADPTIVALTSGTASQNFDIESLSFPRRIAIRFASEWMERYKYAGKLVRFSAYSDDTFSEKLDDKLFGHEQMIDKSGWVYYAFDGKFTHVERKGQAPVGYIKMEIVNPTNFMVMRTFYFKAQLQYQTTLNGKAYIKRPVTNEKVIRNGILTEMKKVSKNGQVSFVDDYTTINKKTKDFATYEDGGYAEDIIVKVPAFSALKLKYSDRQKMIFFVTPPHLMAYARLILILVKQVTDSAMSSSYITKANQKPLYGTRYMLDELGNLQSDGHGIPNLETMLSIGLSAMQQFTLVLQTLAQLIAVYGESVDKIVAGNSNNLIFIKSNDISTVDNLVSLAGKTHRERNNSMSVTTNRMARVKKNDDRVTTTKTVMEEDVLSRNAFLQLKRQESIVLRAGSNPILNYGRSLLPMAWQLFGGYRTQVNVPGMKYSLQTVPTMSSALEFNARQNIPNFYAMVEKRVAQARLVAVMEDRYRKAYNYDQINIDRMDPEIYAREIMDAVNDTLWQQNEALRQQLLDEEDMLPSDEVLYAKKAKERQESGTMMDNTEYFDADREAKSHLVKDYDEMLYAGGTISRHMLVTEQGTSANLGSSVATMIPQAVIQCKGQFMNDPKYRWDEKTQTLRDNKGNVLITYNQEAMAVIKNAAESKDTRTFAEKLPDMHEYEASAYSVTAEFMMQLAKMKSWTGIAAGSFDNAMKQLMEKFDADKGEYSETEAFGGQDDVAMVDGGF